MLRNLVLGLETFWFKKLPIIEDGRQRQFFRFVFLSPSMRVCIFSSNNHSGCARCSFSEKTFYILLKNMYDKISIRFQVSA